MAYKPMNERVADYDEDGVPYMLVEATYKTGDTLPTDHIAQGSWALNLDNKSVVFFDGETSTWG